MADNTTLAAATGGDVIATDDVTTLNGAASTGIKVQRVKATFGDDGTARDVSAAFPMPSNVTDGTNVASVTAGNELVVAFKDLVPASANITAQDIASASAAGANGQSLITGTPTAGSTVTQTVTGDSSFAVLITGTWTGTLQFERSLDAGVTWTSIGAFAAGTPFIVTTTTANGAFHGNASSATTLRIRSIAAWTGTATVRILAGAGTGTITVGNPIRLFDAVSGVQGTIKAGSTLAAATDTALAVAVRDAVTVGTSDASATGSLTAAAQAVTISPINGAGSAGVSISGTFSATVVPEATVDGTNWFTVSMSTPGLSTAQTSATAPGNWTVALAGYSGFRIRCSAFTSGSVTVAIRTSTGSGGNQITAPLPNGTNTIGAVTVASNTNHSQVMQSATVGTTLSAANTTVTLTLAAPGAGLFHYITRIRIINVNPTTTAIAAAATNLSYTTTNLPGTLAWNAGTTLAAGAEKIVADETFTHPLKSSAANTATTIVAPAIGTGGVCRITAYFYTAA